MNILSVARNSNSPAEMWKLIENQVSSEGMATFELDRTSELLVGTNLMRYMGGLRDHEVDYTYGRNLLTELLMFFPRIVYPNRPMTESEQFVSMFYPSVHESGGGFGFFFLLEGYSAFGMPGVALTTFAYGWLSHTIYRWFRMHMNHDVVALAYGGVFYFLALTSVRGGLIGSIKMCVQSALPYVLVLLLLRVRTPGRPRTSNGRPGQMGHATAAAAAKRLGKTNGRQVPHVGRACSVTAARYSGCPPHD
jgi:hypothetical protein